jgi:hypothetical protein
MEDLIRETDGWLAKVMNEIRSPEAVWSSAKEYIDRLFAIHCTNMGKPFWINKTPGFLNYLDGLSTLYPKAKILVMLRDGRDVAVSNLSLPWGPNTVRAAARRWKRLILQGQETIRTKKLECAELRYEELIASPHDLITRAFKLVGLDVDVEKILSSIPVSRGRCGAWRSAFSAKDRKVFAREAGDLLIELGYEKDCRWAD